MIVGNDIASYQASNQKLSPGAAFCFVKVTEGTNYVNPKWVAQRAHVKGMGLVFGAYLFVRSGNITAQCDYFLRQINIVSGDMVAVDWEDSAVSNASKDAAIKYLKKKLPNNRVGLYCNTNFWKNKDTTSYYGDFLWIADYGAAQGKPPIQANWLIHQYSESGGLDKNVAKFNTKAEMAAWAKGGASTPTTPSTGSSSGSGSASSGETVVTIGEALKVLNTAKGEVGYREGKNNYTKYAADMINSKISGVYSWWQYAPWCATFDVWCFWKNGLVSKIPVSAGCANAVAIWKSQGRFSEYPAIGAPVYFGPAGGTHTGIVYAYDNSYIYTYEGNTNTDGSAEGNGVYKKVRARKSSYVYGYGYPKFAEGLVTADPSKKGKAGFVYKATATAPITVTKTLEGDDPVPNRVSLGINKDVTLKAGVWHNVEFDVEWLDDNKGHDKYNEDIARGPMVWSGTAAARFSGLQPGLTIQTRFVHTSTKDGKIEKSKDIDEHQTTTGDTFIQQTSAGSNVIKGRVLKWQVCPPADCKLVAGSIEIMYWD